MNTRDALLLLADGTSFYGKSIGIKGISVGEVVFNTSMTGYQEIITDPSYHSQIITFTNPHIGNTGINPEDLESKKIHTSGIIIRDQEILANNWRKTDLLDNFLKENKIVGISGIDTRKLTKVLRNNGSQNGCILCGNNPDIKTAKKSLDEFPGLENQDLAIVTGASKGIGLSIARGLAEYGAKVVISSRSQESLDLVAKELSVDGLKVFPFACHVGDENQRKDLVKKTIDIYGRIDILVNNAAINPVHDSIEKMSSEVYDKILNVNLKAAFDLSNLCFPYLKKDKEGAIINIASVEGLKPSFGLGLYSITKAALIMLTQVQAKEWGKYGIRSNAICPGLIKTKFSSALWQNEKLKKQIEKHLPAGRVAEPIEMSGLAVYLSSSAGSYTTGGIYTADGGHMTM